MFSSFKNKSLRFVILQLLRTDYFLTNLLFELSVRLSFDNVCRLCLAIISDLYTDNWLTVLTYFWLTIFTDFWLTIFCSCWLTMLTDLVDSV